MFNYLKLFPSIVIIVFILSYPGLIFSQNDFFRLSGNLHFGSVSKLIHDSEGNFFAINSNGVFCSTDSGYTWNQNNNGLTDNNIRDIVFVNDEKIIIGARSGQILQSTNDGQSWENLGSGVSANNALSIVIGENGYFFAGTDNDGVSRSTDNGLSWTTINNGLTNTVVHSLAVDTGGIIYAGTAKGIYRTTDNGNYWTRTLGFADTTIKRIEINDSGFIFAQVDIFLFRSTDGGSNWQNVCDKIIYVPFPIRSIYGAKAFTIAKNGDIIIGDDSRLLHKSTDNGDSWNKVEPIYTRIPFWDETYASINSFDVNSNGDIYASTSEGLFYSNDDGSSWVELNSKLADWKVTSIESASDGYVFAGTRNGAFRSTNNGDTWTINNNGIESYPLINKIIKHNQNNIFAACATIEIPYLFPVFRSTNNGNSWTKTGSEEPNQGNALNDMAINRNGDIYTTSYLHGLRFSTDNGDNWISLPTDGFCLAVNSVGYIYRGDIKVYRSTNNGEEWMEFPFNSGGYFDIRVHKLMVNSNDDLFALTDNGLYRLNNNEDILQHIGDNLPKDPYLIFNTNVDTAFSGPFIDAITINSLNHIFITYHAGVFRSTDNGDSWTKVSSEKFSALSIDSSDYLYAGTSSGSIYKSKGPTTLTSVEDDKNRKIFGFKLYQNYPNPFNPSTSIIYSVPMQCRVTIKIFDILGKEVLTLRDEEKSIGSYSVKFDAGGLPSGIYFYQLKTDDIILTEKMILLR